MNQETNLKLRKKDRPKGLFLFCNGCKNYYANDRAIKCKCRKLVYKARIHISGTKYGYVPRVFETHDFSEAVRQFHEFKSQLLDNAYQTVPVKTERNIPIRLIECFAYYMGYLNNVGVPKHKQKLRDPKYLGKVDNAFQMYKEALDVNGINTSILKFTDVTDEMVGYIHEYFLIEKEYANKTYNNNMGFLSAFTTHIIEEFNLPYKNPFLGVPDLMVTPKVKSIKEGEFEQLLKIVTPENGDTFKVRKGRTNPAKDNLFKPWLKHAFQLGLFTGGRSEDIVELKWSDIRLDERGKFDTLRTIDYKIDKANSNRTSKEERFEKFFAITQELGDLLMEMGYDYYRASDKYIIAPEDSLKRSTVAALISRAFSHYYKQLNTGKQVSFKNLRKTFMTSALREFGVASTALTNHATVSMTNKHYYDKEVTREEAKQNFSVFKKKL